MISYQTFILVIAGLTAFSGVLKVIVGSIQIDRTRELREKYDAADAIMGLVSIGVAVVLVML